MDRWELSRKSLGESKRTAVRRKHEEI